MIFFDSHRFFCPELSRFPPCSPSIEDAILDSKLESVAQRFQVCYVQKIMREIWHRSCNVMLT